jgi:prepilin-type N-terminal cleavage/methylation domain-containing protein
MIIMRRGITLIELIIVLAIIAVMLGLLVPAVLRSREKAREAVCKNNLHQLALALVQLHETAKELPARPRTGQSGGWSVEILPFLEQRSLYGEVGPNLALSAVPIRGHSRPIVMRCPISLVAISSSPPIDAAHFVLTPDARRESWWLFDAPTGFREPWLTGPEMEYAVLTRLDGPHHGGFHAASSDGAVRLLIGGATAH